jgi:hypothetical protein
MSSLTSRNIFLASLLIVVIVCWLGLRAWDDSLNAPYQRVEDGLYIGRASKILPPNTEAIVNLCGIEDRQPVKGLFWEPVLEGGAEPSLDWLRRAVSFIAEQRHAGRVTFVHCLAGTNRSATVVTAFLMHDKDWPRDRALEFLQRRRPQAQPNPEMMRLLAQYETER